VSDLGGVKLVLLLLYSLQSDPNIHRMTKLVETPRELYDYWMKSRELKLTVVETLGTEGREDRFEQYSEFWRGSN